MYLKFISKAPGALEETRDAGRMEECLLIWLGVFTGRGGIWLCRDFSSSLFPLLSCETGVKKYGLLICYPGRYTPTFHRKIFKKKSGKLKMFLYWDFPGGLVVKTPYCRKEWARVRSLVRELRSHMPCHVLWPKY